MAEVTQTFILVLVGLLFSNDFSYATVLYLDMCDFP